MSVIVSGLGLGRPRVRIRLIAYAYDLYSRQAPVDPIDPRLTSELYNTRDGRHTYRDGVLLGLVRRKQLRSARLVARFRELSLRS